jgi:glycosyltransferase involved in cell wall biosynthesis
MPRRTVLHVAQPFDAGVPRVVGDLVDDQVRRGWEVVVASPAGGDAARRAAAAGARHLAWEATRDPGPGVPGEVARLRRVVATVAPDLVHLHSAKAGLAGRLLLRGRRPTVFQPHAWSFLSVTGPVRAASTAWERWAARWSHALLCVSPDERRSGEAAGLRGRWAEIANGIDLDRFPEPEAGDRAAARAALGLPGVPLAVVVGRLARQKGQDVLLDAWPAVRERVADAELVLVGDGPDRAALEDRAVAGVRFAGKQEDVRPWLAAADVVASPSRWEAGLSLAAMEAMAAARPLVATAVEGMGEVEAAGAGAVVPVDGAARLAAALADRLADPARAAAEGAAGRAHVLAEHDLRVTTARVAELYDELLAASSSTSTSIRAHSRASG